jgi:DNA-binding response OmpR family regulator
VVQHGPVDGNQSSAGMRTILIVDDDRVSADLARTYLARDGYSVQSAATGEEAHRAVLLSRPDLIVLSLHVASATDGWGLCRRLRAESGSPILVVARHSNEVDLVVGLEVCADDYLVMPFNPRELVARVGAILRRWYPSESSTVALTVGNLCVDTERYEATVGGQVVALAPKEFKLLAVLARQPGHVIARERLIELAWPVGCSGSSHALDVQMSGLRQKLRGSALRIEGVWGIGFRVVEAVDDGPRFCAEQSRS